MNHPSFERCWLRSELSFRLAALILTCLGTVVFSLNASAETETRIISLSGNLNFGNVVIGTSNQRTLTISNLGNSMLTVSNIYPPQPVSLLGGFSADWSGAIEPGASVDVTVTFAPGGNAVLNNTAPVDYSGSLNVGSDATSGTNSIEVSGFGVLRQFATRVISVTNNLNFGPIQIGTMAASMLVISNRGNADLTVSNISFPDGFSTFIDVFTNGTIPARGHTNLYIIFAPTNVMPYSGKVTIDSDATGGKGEFTVSGQGAYPTGQFIGLFSPGIDAAFDNSGSFTANVAANGAFSGVLQLAGARRPFSGRLSPSATFSGPLSQKSGNSLGASFQVSPYSWHGIISNDTWSAALTAYRTFHGPRVLRFPGEVPPTKYQFHIAGSTNLLLAPTNDGVGTIKFSLSRPALLSGTLADGTPFTQNTTLGGQLPLYASLYHHQGAVMGWIDFEFVPTNFPIPQIIPLTNLPPFTNFPTFTNPPILITNHPPLTNSAYTNFPSSTDYPPGGIVMIALVPHVAPPMLPPSALPPVPNDLPRGHLGSGQPGAPFPFPGTNRISGLLNWFKPPQIDPSYPDGFSFQTTVNGPTD